MLNVDARLVDNGLRFVGGIACGLVAALAAQPLLTLVGIAFKGAVRRNLGPF
jgi:hypothetical protein